MEITGFLQTIYAGQGSFDAARDLYRDRLAPEFNPFDFIEPDEMKLSRILAWLLDPAGSHGQGSRFLDLLLAATDRPWPAADTAKALTKTEVPVEGGRIDILVRLGKRVLAIENKPWPWSGDTEGQLARYFAYFDKEGADYFLLYLTAAGSEPTSIGEEEIRARVREARLRLWSYRNEFLRWLEECRSVSRADRVSVFIDQFCSYIRRETEGAREMASHDYLLDQVTSSKETVSSAMQVVLAGDAIRERLLSELLAQLCEKAKGRHWHLDWEMPSPRQFAGFVISPSVKSPWGFCLEFQSAQYRGLWYGIYKKDVSLSDDRRTAEAIENVAGAGRSNQHWIWVRPTTPQDDLLSIEPDWGASVSPWVAIVDGSLSNMIVAAAERFFSALNQ